MIAESKEMAVVRLIADLCDGDEKECICFAIGVAVRMGISLGADADLIRGAVEVNLKQIEDALRESGDAS